MAQHPAAGRHLLGIDLGTSSVKVALTDLTGAVVASATEPYPVAAPHPGRAETDPAAWLDAVTRAVRQVARASNRSGAPAHEIAAVGLSGQMHGLVLTGADGAPTRPAMLHLDTRATADLDTYRALPGAVLDRLANPLSPNMAGPMLLWAARRPGSVHGHRYCRTADSSALRPAPRRAAARRRRSARDRPDCERALRIRLTIGTWPSTPPPAGTCSASTWGPARSRSR
jgi:hypothetical protein